MRVIGGARLAIVLGAVGALLVYIVAIVASGAVPGASESSLMRWVDAAGPAAPIVFIVLLGGAVIVAPVPNTPFFIVAGAIWGPVLGSVYAMAGMVAGSFIAFLLARNLPISSIVIRLPEQARARLEATPDSTKPWILFWARLLPATNYDWANYVAGFSSIRVLPFLAGTSAGIAPATIATVVVGSALEDEPMLAAGVTVAWLLAAGGSLAYVIRRRRDL